MISVIVPVYNVEPYLARCVNSILQQSYTDFELLLVDDGSTDRSGDICEKIAEKDSRIRVFHKKNGGLSDARNFGLDQIRGEFVSFIDSDDYVGPDYLRILVEMREQFQADISMLASISTVSDEMDFVASTDERERLNPEETLKKISGGIGVGVSAWGKLYRRDLFRKTKFPVRMLYEDLYTTPYLLEDCRICAFSTSVQYYYYQRHDSITHRISDSAAEMWNVGMERLYDYIKEKVPGAEAYVIRRYISFAFGTIINNLIDSEDYVAKAQTFRDRHIDWWRSASSNPYLDKKEKIKAFLFLKDVRLYRVFYKLYQIKKKLG